MRIHHSVVDLVKCLGPGRFVFQQRINRESDGEAYVFRWVPKGYNRIYPGPSIAIRPEVFWGTA